MLKKDFRKTFYYGCIFVAFLFIFVHQGQAKPGSHFLWKIDSKGNTVYLLGSLHLFKPAFYPLDPVIESAYKASSTLVFEADASLMNTPEVQSILVDKGLYRNGDTLKKNVSGNTYRQLEFYAGKTNLPVDYLNKMKPWLCAVTLTTATLTRQGFSPKDGLDAYFLKKARQDNKSILFLETPQFQLGLFADISDQMQGAILEQSLEDLKIAVKFSSEMIAAWKNGNTDALASMIMTSMKDHPKLYNAFFVQRNQRWVPIIETVLKERKSSLVIVGSGHLVGKHNVIDLMKAKGYSIIQQ